MNKLSILGWVFTGSLVAAVGGPAAMVPVYGTLPMTQVPPSLRQELAGSDILTASRWDLERSVRLASSAVGYSIRFGVASWYDGPTQITANGEAFQPDGLTAASRTLPFDTRVRVTNLRNGLSVVVRINDRGPYVDGRAIDLTPEAADELGMLQKGLAPVSIEILENDVGFAADRTDGD